MLDYFCGFQGSILGPFWPNLSTCQAIVFMGFHPFLTPWKTDISTFSKAYRYTREFPCSFEAWPAAKPRPQWNEWYTCTCIFPPPFSRSPLGQEKNRFFRFLVGLVLVFPWLHFGVLGFHFGLRGSMACFLAALWKSRKAIFRVQKSCRFGRQKIKNN